MATKVKPSRLQVSWTPQAWQVPVYVNDDCFQWCASGWCAQWWCIAWTLCDQTDLQWALDCKQDKACMVCNLSSPDDNHYPSAKAVADAMACAGTWDMLKSVYDPNNIQANVYDYCNFVNTPTIPTNNNQLTNGCGYTTCTWTLVASDLNPYATCCYVNDAINSVTAYYITKNAQGDQWASYAELAAATTFYSGWAVRVPTRNDYTVVLDDETHSNATTRYSYQWSWWEYQYTINESPMTQAQLDALNSWITAAKVSAYDAIPIITDNCQIANWCGYTTCTGTVSTCADVISALGYTPYSTGNPCNYINNFAGVVSALGYTPYNTTNPCGYTTCTGTISTCSQIISTLWYTPYNSTNPNGYTSCTWTLTQSAISDTAFWASWDADTTHAPSKNAIYDVLWDVETLLANL